MTTFITTTIPYVNAAPHLGFALEAVQADTLARHRRQRGEAVRLLSGTDDNSLKNVLSAEAAGVAVGAFVDANAAAFEALAAPLALSYDDFIRTSRDPRHRRGVEALWRACDSAGDLYQDRYEGLYCVGCEHYLTPDELDGAGHCPEHAAPPQRIAEHNWFFRLSRYADALLAAIESGRLRIEPEPRRNEVLAFIKGGLRDFSVSRSQDRARGWGIEVPGDPGQVIYVWWDALGNYVTSLGYGAPDGIEASGITANTSGASAPAGGPAGTALDRWWTTGTDRIHVVGKGVLRFHAVYWPAMLLSAGLELPSAIFVHDYLTAGGEKISKSRGTGTADPVALTSAYGADAVRWWLLRDVPRVGDADFTPERLVSRANEDLAGGFGNLVNRVVTMAHRFRSGIVPEAELADPDAAGLLAACADAPASVSAALSVFDFRRATSAVCAITAEANRYIEQVRPWALAKSAAQHPGDGERLDTVLVTLVYACRTLAEQLTPFLPGASARIATQVTADENGRLPVPAKVFELLATDLLAADPVTADPVTADPVTLSAPATDPLVA